MGILNVGQMQTALQNYDAASWVKSAEIKQGETLSFKDTPHLPFENADVQKTFSEFLTDSVSKVNELQQNANVAISKLATGETRNLHETMLQVEQADMAFRTMNQIRMKVLDAYKEFMKMQV